MGWAEQQQIHLDFIEPGKPQQNAYMEQFSRTVRRHWLEQHLFDTIEQVPDGYGIINTTDRIWRSADSLFIKNYKWQFNLYF